MNEPFAGDVYKDPLLFVPAVAGARNLAPMHETVAAAIRKADDRHIVFYEPVTWGMFLNGKVVGSGYHRVPGGDEYQNRSAMSYHYYCASLVPGYADHPEWRRAICDHVLAPSVMHSVKKDLQRVGGAAVMTEGLACPDRAVDECQAVMKELDNHLSSWTDYGDSQGETWGPSAVTQESWARTYARAVAGKPLSMSFDPKSKEFNFCFVPNLQIQAPTEIFASRYYSYLAGMDVTTTPNLRVNTSLQDVVLLTHSGEVNGDGKACVKIQRRPTVV